MPISEVSFGRDRTGLHNDRDPGRFIIKIAQTDNVYANGNDSNDTTEYTTIFDSSQFSFSGFITNDQTVHVNFTPITARFVMIFVTNAGTDIDELEIFGP